MAKEKSKFMFPISPTESEGWEQQLGITKREYFAAKALQGLMVQSIPGEHNSNLEKWNNERAIFAVNMADALIKALEL